MRAVTHHPHTRRRRRGGRGQALVETALAAPFLLVLLAGSAQLGTFAYAQVSTDTAAREAARVAVERPNASLAWSSPSGPSQTHVCTSGDASPACAAALSAFGALQSVGAKTVTITAPVSVPSQGAAASPYGCTATWDDRYVTVTVTYDAPVFVPLVGRLVAGPSGSDRVLTASVTMRVDPCNATLGG